MHLRWSCRKEPRLGLLAVFGSLWTPARPRGVRTFAFLGADIAVWKRNRMETLQRASKPGASP